ncbi:MAG: CHAT domain-containing protein, partial [Actinomycetia bacterium]|nr:CHAT domain-containing protein [Actinomycetes bacterium]
SPSRVLDWAERTRSAALLAVEPPAPDAVRDERAELAAVYGELVTARRNSGADPAALIARQTALEHRIRRATWHRSGSGEGAATVVTRSGQVAALLGDSTLVSYGRYDGELYAVVLDGRRRLIRLGPYTPVKYEADALQFAMRRMTRPGPAVALDSARASAAHSLDRLAEILVRPLGIDPAAPLVVVPARETHRLPWTALHSGPVSVNPSATLWAATASRAGSKDDRVVIVAGPDLPGADQEAAVVGSRHSAPLILTPPESSVEAVLDAIAGADLVHFACHGYLRADNPTFSALEVSDGRLTVHELDLRGIAPRRVVLASCDSAADVSYAGGELLGFVGALLSRGTAGLVASVVAVGDVEAVALMGALHTRLAAGMTTAAALHAARAGVDTSDPRQFVNWCAFTAYGAG